MTKNVIKLHNNEVPILKQWQPTGISQTLALIVALQIVCTAHSVLESAKPAYLTIPMWKNCTELGKISTSERWGIIHFIFVKVKK